MYFFTPLYQDQFCFTVPQCSTKALRKRWEFILLTDNGGSTFASVDFTIGDENTNVGLPTLLAGCTCIFKRIKVCILKKSIQVKQQQLPEFTNRQFCNEVGKSDV